MTHVMVVPSDRGGCGYYRLIWPAQAVSLVRPDWTVSVVPGERVKAGLDERRELAEVHGFPRPMPDLLVVQRVGTRAAYLIMKWAQEQGVATVVDFDDAMWAIDRGNSAYKAWNSPFMDGTNAQDWRLCDEAAKIADLVTVTTEHLGRRYAEHGRVKVVPNRVPRAAVDLPGVERDEPFTAGWAGFTRTHPGDCTVSAPAARAVLDHGGRLRVIADAVGAEVEWGLLPGDVDPVPAQPLGPEYYTALSRLDLMLVGLRDTQFNRSKSTLKVLEAASAGAPAIAPDNPPHRALAKTGFPVALASTPDEWYCAGRRFADDPAYREHMAHAVREKILEHTIEGNAEQWAQAWERAMERNRTR